MKLFWKINLIISVTVFSLFILIMLRVWKSIFPTVISLISFLAPFLEVIQIPVCLVVTLLNLKNQTKIVWFYFLLMLLFFLIKITVFILVLGSIVPSVNW